MPRTALTSEFKKAISTLPAKEKDKLLYRLLAKEPALVAKLSFELLEGGDTTEQRREEIEENINRYLERYQSFYYSPGYLLLELREMSGMINRHVKTTKDKFGEIYLNFLMLNTAMTFFGDQIREASAYRARTFNEYLVKRALKLLNLMMKLHEDYVMEFATPMRALGNHIKETPTLMKTATNQGLDINWLLEGELPDY